MLIFSRSSRGSIEGRLIAAGFFALVLLSGSALHAEPTAPSKAPAGAPPKKPASPATAQATPMPQDLSVPDRLSVTSDLALDRDDAHESLAALRAAQAAEPSPPIDTTCNLGIIARYVGSNVEAAENLTRCMAAYKAVPPEQGGEERIALIEGELAIARSAVAIVTLKTSKGATVTIDGRPIGSVSADREIFLEPGWHTFIATKGTESVREHANFARGDVRSVSLVPPPPLTAPSRRGTLIKVGWVLTGSAAAAGSILLAGFLINQNIASNELGQVPAVGRVCASPEGDIKTHCDAFANAQTLANRFEGGTIAAFAAAGALALGTTIYTVWGPRSSPRAVVGLGSVGVVVPF